MMKNKFKSTYKKLLNESFLIDKPEFLLKTYCGLTNNDFYYEGLNLYIENKELYITPELVENGKLKFKIFVSNKSVTVDPHAKITTLENFPQFIYGDLNCFNNELTNLDFFPKTVFGSLQLENNKLTSLKGITKLTVNGILDLTNNDLTSLEHFPTLVNKCIYLSENGLTSLEGITQKRCYGNFRCSFNDLTSLKCCPTEIDNDFFCTDNNLTSLEHFPTFVGGDLLFYNNKIKCSFKDIEAVCVVKGDIVVE